jgi:hypothetical protein
MRGSALRIGRRCALLKLKLFVLILCNIANRCPEYCSDAVWKTVILTMRFLKAIDKMVGFKIIGVLIV